MSHKHLTAEERSWIEFFLGQEMSSRDIAVALSRSHTSISRELRRNRSLSGYRGQTAQKRAESRRKQPRHYRRQHHEPLVAYVEKKLRNDWSPEQIANRMCRDYPDDYRMRISAEAVYAWVILQLATEAPSTSTFGEVAADADRRSSTGKASATSLNV